MFLKKIIAKKGDKNLVRVSGFICAKWKTPSNSMGCASSPSKAYHFAINATRGMEISISEKNWSTHLKAISMASALSSHTMKKGNLSGIDLNSFEVRVIPPGAFPQVLDSSQYDFDPKHRHVTFHIDPAQQAVNVGDEVSISYLTTYKCSHVRDGSEGWKPVAVEHLNFTGSDRIRTLDFETKPFSHIRFEFPSNKSGVMDYIEFETPASVRPFIFGEKLNQGIKVTGVNSSLAAWKSSKDAYWCKTCSSGSATAHFESTLLGSDEHTAAQTVVALLALAISPLGFECRPVLPLRV